MVAIAERYKEVAKHTALGSKCQSAGGQKGSLTAGVRSLHPRSEGQWVKVASLVHFPEHASANVTRVRLLQKVGNLAQRVRTTAIHREKEPSLPILLFLEERDGLR